jgi:hypothetical protein
MRRLFIGILAGTALAFAGATQAAAATSVTGNVNVNGFVVGNTPNIQDSTALDFTDGSTTGPADGVLSGYVGNINGNPLLCNTGSCGSIKDINSLVVGAQSIPLFFALTGAGAGISFDLTGISSINRSSPGKLYFDATGFLNAPGSTATAGIFTLTTQGNGQVQTTFSASTAVPEPATWALMLLGFGAIGVSMRRRRRPALAQLA